MISMEYRGVTLLEKAKLERRSWDKARKQGKSREEWFEALQTLHPSVRPQEVRQRSNLLKRGVRDPKVWEQVEQGVLSYGEAIRAASRTAPKPHAHPRRPTPQVEPQAEELAASITAQLAKLVALSQRPPDPISASRPPVVPSKTQTDEFYTELSNRIWEWFQENGFLNADFHQVYEIVNHTMTEMFESLEFFRRSCNRAAGGRRPPINKGVTLHTAFKILGLPFQDPASPGFDFRAVRRAFKKQALRYHPDRNNGQNIYKAEYQKILSAMTTIERAWQITKN